MSVLKIKDKNGKIISIPVLQGPKGDPGYVLTEEDKKDIAENIGGWTDFYGVETMKILAVGDSICYGARNEGKGYVGDLGLPYKNVSVSGASLSNVVTTKTNIPNQLINVTDYDPYIIIANGGGNDYTNNAPLGTLSLRPVSTDEEAEALDRSTVAGGMEYLFYKMITLYPKAQRFYLISHKVFRTDNSTYWPTTQNTAGWTQQDYHDLAIECCNLYNVKVIDVYNEGIINTLFSEYRSSVAYSDDNSVTNTEYVDKDGRHPLAYGYLQGYAPIIRKAIGAGTHFTDVSEAGQ